MAAGHLAAVSPAEFPDRGLPVVPVRKWVWADRPDAVDPAHHPEIRLASGAAQSVRRAALPGEPPGAEHREPSRLEGFEGRSEAAADEVPKAPVPVSASQWEWGVAERESGGLAPQVKAMVKTDRETKAREKMQPVAVRSSAPEPPGVVQAARRKPVATLQLVDESALFRSSVAGAEALSAYVRRPFFPARWEPRAPVLLHLQQAHRPHEHSRVLARPGLRAAPSPGLRVDVQLAERAGIGRRFRPRRRAPGVRRLSRSGEKSPVSARTTHPYNSDAADRPCLRQLNWSG